MFPLGDVAENQEMSRLTSRRIIRHCRLDVNDEPTLMAAKAVSERREMPVLD